MNHRTIMTQSDYDLLSAMFEGMSADDRHHFADLGRALSHAECVDAGELPPDVVSLGSKVVLRELETGDAWTFTLSLPSEADVDEHRISVLSPLGIAILGRQVGSIVKWPVPAGAITIRIEELLFQPESAGTPNEAGSMGVL